MINDPEIQKAVANVTQRSEKQTDMQKLVGSYVDVGILPQLINNNSQIVYGRRGTGKTHLATVLSSKLKDAPNAAIVYIDARTLGSTAQFTDASLPLSRRCTALYRDILGEVHNALLEYVVNHPTSRADAALTDLTGLSKVATEPFVQQLVTEVSETTSETTASANSVGATFASQDASVDAKSEVSTSISKEAAVSSTVGAEDKVVFPAVIDLIRGILEKAECSLTIVIDEWSSLPLDVQPYLAEFIKRSFLPTPKVVVKIASLEYRSRFGIPQQQGHILGFEIGSDIATALDLDDYFVYDRNPDQVTMAFADILYRHISNELPPGYLTKVHGIHAAGEFVTALFTNSNIFSELVRASEGVARDLINIFSQAFWSAKTKARDKIDKRAIVEAARQWFEQDKAQNLDDELVSVLQRIVNDVIGKRKARSFLLPRELDKHDVIQRLFDLRVVHLVQRGYADKDNPGVRYNIYTLDFGTYVDLLGTSKAPAMAVDVALGIVDEGGVDVPLDDKRTIRRIVLSRDILEGTPQQGSGHT